MGGRLLEEDVAHPRLTQGSPKAHPRLIQGSPKAVETMMMMMMIRCYIIHNSNNITEFRSHKSKVYL
jgi:hypothetical protein